MSRVVRAGYEGGVQRPLEPVDLEEGEEVRIQVLPEEFPELVDKVCAEVCGDGGEVLREGRERWRKWY